MKFALYGLPCSGKTHLLSQVEGIAVFHGSTVLNEMSNGNFADLTPVQKASLRKKYCERIKNFSNGHIISDGHYAFLNDVVFTESDAETYDVFIYLYCSVETLSKRYLNSSKNMSYANILTERIHIWQSFEIENLRKCCHSLNKDFHVIDSEKITPENFSEFLRKIIDGYSPHRHAKKIIQQIELIYPNACNLTIIDGDKTIIKQDTFSVCTNGYKTSAFEGNFYSGYQSLNFATETENLSYSYEKLEKISLNECVYNTVKTSNYVVLSAGVTSLWEKLGNILGLKNIIANPLICADTKYFVIKGLREDDYTITAYGDSKNDVFMLKEADRGFLVIGEKLSRSLRDADTSGIKLLYDKSPVILSKQSDSLNKDIAVCKSNSGINGGRLAEAHYRLGMAMGKAVGEIIPNDDIAVIVMERGGRFFGDGFYIGFSQHGNLGKSSVKFYPYNPKQNGMPNISNSKIIIVDSVINSGNSILKTVHLIQEINPNSEIFIVSNVIQTHALEKLSAYKVFAVRTSENSFIGKNQSVQTGNTGPDTADRLFNLIE